MPTHLVNLDALIERDDFESAPDDTSEATGAGTPPFTLSGLKRGEPFFNALRKPDFQRDTTNWSPKTIVEFVRSFLDNELIPSIILWQSPTNRIFIIDGAHRFSALIAWVNDDYGDGEISREFFGHNISSRQMRFDKETRQLMESIGSFKKLDYFARHPKETSNPTLLRRAFATTTQPLYFQKVTGDAKTAEKSFFKINSKPAVIDTTELDVIKARLKPNAIATRALMRAGTGHRYWGKFPKASKISELAHEVYDLLFGEIVELGTRSPDVPRAGQPYSAEAFKMILDMVNLFNGISDSMWQGLDEEDELDKLQAKGNRRKPKDVTPKLPDDTDGAETLKLLRKVREVAQLTSDYDYVGSLGFDQAVYSYGKAGKFHPTAFIGSLSFAKELADKKQAYAFTKIREPFEEFLARHKSFINDLGHSKGSRLKALGSFLTMYRIIMKALRDGITDDSEIVAKLKAEPSLKRALKEEEPNAAENPAAKKFSKGATAAAVVRDKLATRGRCPICGARLPEYVRSKDHMKDIKFGGLGSVDNLQFAHPYCNSIKTDLEREKEAKAS